MRRFSSISSLAALLEAGGRILAAEPTPNLADFQIDPRLEIQLWAKEPQVVSPVALCWDDSGAVYVAECRDYPYGAGPEGRVGSTVRRLADSNGDGVPDQVTLFAGDLSFVTSVTPWRGGILAIAPPDLWWLQDTNRDGVADRREVVLTGFNLGVSDSLANGLRFGLDNLIHGANGGSSGSLRSPKTPDQVTRLDQNDFAFHPDTGVVALTAPTGGGFGLAFDEFGRAFTPYNISHIQHRFVPLAAARRYSGFPPVTLTDSISDHGEMSRIYPISAAQTRPNHPEQAGHFSAAGGMSYFASPLFPADLRGSVLVGDVVGNLIHRDVIRADGPVFVASRAPEEQHREFLASRDGHFRPVAFEFGPDGALYVADMQREVIEHPDYIPEKMRRTLDVRAGDQRGRIYRITPKSGLPPMGPRLGEASRDELVATLGHAQPWWRLTAQRLLVERQDKSAAPALAQLARTATNPAARAQALWTLRGLGELRAVDVANALADADPPVRETALQLAEAFLPAEAALHAPVLRSAEDVSARVRFVAAQSLGALGNEAAADALQRILAQDYSHRWSRLSVLAALAPEHQRRFVEGLWANSAFTAATEVARLETLESVADLLGARGAGRPDDVAWLIAEAPAGLSGPARAALLDGLAAGLERSGAKPEIGEAVQQRLANWSRAADVDEMRALWRLTRALGLPESAEQREALARARRDAADNRLPLPDRLGAVRLLALGVNPTTTEGLLALLDAREPTEIQLAALTGLRSVREPSLGAALVGRWRVVSPGLRPRLLELLLDRRAFHDALLTALEDGRLQIGELNLDLEQRRRLLRGGTAEVRERARRFMGDEEYSNRKALVEEWLARLPAEGDPQRGQQVFAEACAQCHFAGGTGHRVGPDLAGVSHRSVEDLLSNILDPNMAINPGFVASTIELRDGESQTGLLEVETAESVTLRQAEGVRVVVPRRDIVRIESSGQSLMPEGLEAGRTPQQLRDLIAFMQQSAPAHRH